jgi:Uma2 family endonuclease
MTREEFHRIYEQMPEDFRAELIGGIVYVSPPMRRPHGTNHLPLGTLFFLYEGSTPGVESGDNTTILLGHEGEPQPDLFLRILPEFGGQSSNEDEYVSGPPELVAEIAHSSRAIDLYEKRQDYAKHGVKEYLVLCVAERQLRWFDLGADAELAADSDGVLRIRTFPGLWLNADAVLKKDSARMLSTLQQGLATPEHAKFVQVLASRKRGAEPRVP